MRKIIVTAIVIILCSLKVLTQSKLSNEEYKVLTLFLNKDAKSLLIIGNETTDEKKNIKAADLDFNFLKSQFEGILKETAIDFILKNRKTASLDRKIDTKAQYILLDRKTFESYFSNKRKSDKDPWKNFYKRYPNSNGFTEFSRIGFSKDRKQAFIYVSNRCGWLCGSGYYYFLVKENDVWTIKGESMIWVS